jgi:indolepyruvate ferredoxin oxidoreductase beta subunit
MDQAAKDAGSILNAVLLGALAGAGALPLRPEDFEAGIRDDGKAVDSNLSGFRFGLSHGRGEIAAMAERDAAVPAAAAAPLMRDRIAALPETARRNAAEGVKRLLDYQDAEYARLYLDRLDRIVALGDDALAVETARHLALRMSFEDVIRVAQLKLKPERFAAIERETRVKNGQPYTVADYLKPGIEEIASLLPGALARPLILLSARRGWLETVHFGMTVRSNRLGGWLRFRLLAALRPWRPHTHRYAEEQARIEDWIDSICRAANRDRALAREIVDCARLIKGYGDTFKRGAGNYEAIRAQIILPALEGRVPATAAADALVQARTAALADPEGASLGQCLSGFAASLPPLRQAAD